MSSEITENVVTTLQIGRIQLVIRNGTVDELRFLQFSDRIDISVDDNDLTNIEKLIQEYRKRTN